MTHISIDRNGKSFHVPEASVSDLMSLLDQQFEASRLELEGATKIIKYVCKPKDVKMILDAAPDELVWLALKILGFEPKDPDESDDEESGEGKPSSQGTST